MLVVYQTANSNTPAISSASTALAANSKRNAWRIQNLGTNILYVLLGNGATTSVFHYALTPSTVQDDGLGGSAAQSNGIVFTGPITVAGTTPRYTIMEM